MTDISVGDVFYMECSFLEVTKNKYLVLVKTKPNRFFIINSKINKFIESNTSLLRCQVDVPYLDHSWFLKHDSIADCSDVIDTHSVINDSQLIFNNLLDYRVGRLAEYVLGNIVEVLINYNTTLKTKDLKVIISSLNEVLTPTHLKTIAM